ncbi:MAG: serine/threonine protein kinase [Phycisphaerales bacterium]|nr:serine/threonine protein kinase [Phycisphaerales bacterium]MCB9854717.1 serine/threonine protein kinase [Phycisphaerales bacterium]
MSSWVERMIAAEEKPSPLFSGSSCDPAIRFTAPDMTDARIGRYTIKRKIGAGGMGTVYEAIQDKPQRSVAVKVLPGGAVSTIAARRFEYESSVLGRLHHPGIAQILEAGIHREGGVALHYIAMELVSDACPITAYVNGKKLAIRDAVALFVRVCDAVQHGHQLGVIHRDLKPDNVLIDSNGNPKIIDFGVARAIERDDGNLTHQTEAGQLIGTVMYMSPEQISGVADIDIRTDVFSLGVVLFEMLTSGYPFDFGPSMAQAIRSIQECEPKRSGSVNPAIPIDLDTIIAKALQKERDRRYPTVAEFGNDLRRFLQNEPIEARRPSVGYQARKFAQRNKGLTATSGIVVIALIGGLAAERYRANEAVEARNAETIARHEADEARIDATLEAGRARLALDVLTGVFTKAIPDEATGKRPTMQELIEELAHDIESDAIELPPETEATIWVVLGEMYLSQGMAPRALTALNNAAAIHNELGLKNIETIRMLTLLTGAHTALGEYEEAVAILDQLEPELDPSNERLRGFAMLAETYRKTIQFQTGQVEQAIMPLKSAVDGASQSDAQVPRVQHVARGNRGTMLAQTGRLDEAETILREEIEWFKSGDDAFLPELLPLQRSLAFVEFSRGNLDEAAQILNEAIDGYPSNAVRKSADLADALEDLGRILNRKKDYSGAEPRLREAIAIRESLFGPDHISTAMPMTFLSIAVSKQDRLEEGRKLAKRALALQEAQGQTQTELYTQSSNWLKKLDQRIRELEN